MADVELSRLALNRCKELWVEVNEGVQRMAEVEARENKERTMGSMAYSSYMSDTFWAADDKIRLAARMEKCADELLLDSGKEDEIRGWLAEQGVGVLDG